MRIKPPFVIEQYRRTNRGTFFALLCSTATGYLLTNMWCAGKERKMLITALKSIANNTCCEGCGEAAKVAKKALEDL